MNITKVANLDAVTRFECEWKSEAFWFEAKTASLTPYFLKNIDKSQDYPSAIAAIVTDWNITAGDNDADKWPLTVEALGTLPLDFLGFVINKIGESWAGDTKKQSNSASG